MLQPASWVVVGLLFLGGCQSNTSPKTETKTAEKQATAAPAPPATSVVPGPPFVGYHRYRGTVGGQPVTVELTIGPDPEKPALVVCAGSYHYDRHPAGRLLLSGPRPFQFGQPLVLAETDTARSRQPTGHWQATQPCGPVLVGSWHSPAGQVLPFSLREDYTDGQGYLMAVQYELLQEREEAPTQSERQPGESKAAYRARTKDLISSSSRVFVHLLGPDTLRPALRTLQCPVPAERRRLMREDLGYPGGVELLDELTVSYNDHGLLSLASFHNGDYKDAVHPEHGAGSTTYDLRTGRALTIAELIRPGTDTSLSRLITRHLEQQDITAEDLLNHLDADATLAPLPQQGLGIVDEGLEFTYTSYEILPYVYPPVTLVVPWAELLPLLRPTSPVARMLRARGLWRGTTKE